MLTKAELADILEPQIANFKTLAALSDNDEVRSKALRFADDYRAAVARYRGVDEPRNVA